MSNSLSWQCIFDDYDILKHDFSVAPYHISAEQIKKSTAHLDKTSQKEVRILAKQDTRESIPQIFVDNNLFLLPTTNGKYAIIQGEGYVDIPKIETQTTLYKSKLEFELESSKIGNSEMQHLDFAYAVSMVRTFMDDCSLVLTIRGRKYTPEFEFLVGDHKQTLKVHNAQTEVDGYEGRDKMVLIGAKNSITTNTLISQMYYPFKQWSSNVAKDVLLVLFEKQDEVYNFWEFTFTDPNDYNSIKILRSQSFIVK